MNIGKRLQMVRQSRDLTIKEVSEIISNNSYDRIEKGSVRLNFDDMLKICKALDIEVWDLVAKELIITYREKYYD
jgi:transcriptional regulator with XRE-family HTH domain